MPKKIGKYELGKTLGSGNFSKVKVGIEDGTGSQWAIKVIDKSLLVKEQMEEQLKREIAVMKLLRHENVVQLKEVLQTMNHIYLVLELVTGGELFDRILAAKKFDEATSRKYFQQLVFGVSFCHSQGIAHRDLKPENILLDSSDNVKISDFGLSNLQRGDAKGGGTLLQTVCGTPNYVAPEVLKEKGYNGFMADVWSCGVILFVMLAGYLPFDDPNMNALFNKIERGEYRMAKHFSDGVKDLLSKILVVDPTQRLTLNEVIDHPWFQVNVDKENLMRSKGGSSTLVSVSDEQVRNAVADSIIQDTDGVNVSKPEKRVIAAAQNSTLSGLDAFEITARLTLNPLLGSSAASGKSSTRILFGGSSDECARAVMTVLETLKGTPKGKEGSNEIKGFVNASKGLLTYVVSVIPTCAQYSLIEVKRGRGDVFDFHQFFRQINEGLGTKAKSSVLTT